MKRGQATFYDYHEMHEGKLNQKSSLSPFPLSLNKIFTIASTDSAWQASVSCLAVEADMILIDLSGAKESVVWELRQCDALGRLDRVLLLVRGSEREAVLQLLPKVEIAGDLDRQLLIYDGEEPGGIARATELIAARLTNVGIADATQELSIPKALQDSRLRLQLCVAAIVVAMIVVFEFILVHYLDNRP